jgi:hypothetical protein
MARICTAIKSELNICSLSPLAKAGWCSCPLCGPERRAVGTFTSYLPSRRVP